MIRAHHYFINSNIKRLSRMLPAATLPLMDSVGIETDAGLFVWFASLQRHLVLYRTIWFTRRVYWDLVRFSAVRSYASRIGATRFHTISFRATSFRATSFCATSYGQTEQVGVSR